MRVLSYVILILVLFVTFNFRILIASEMETLWIDDCLMRSAPTSTGSFSKKQCSCMYQKASKILNEKQILASELANSFRKINKIEKPAIAEADKIKIFSTSIQVTKSCIMGS
ncbi:hypothetical protein OAC62_05890 [Amylibacter sp.]|nr:hypothetical protein [Amylibacter sp.]